MFSYYLKYGIIIKLFSVLMVNMNKKCMLSRKTVHTKNPPRRFRGGFFINIVQLSVKKSLVKIVNLFNSLVSGYFLLCIVGGKGGLFVSEACEHIPTVFMLKMFYRISSKNGLF